MLFWGLPEHKHSTTIQGTVVTLHLVIKETYHSFTFNFWWFMWIVWTNLKKHNTIIYRKNNQTVSGDTLLRSFHQNLKTFQLSTTFWTSIIYIFVKWKKIVIFHFWPFLSKQVKMFTIIQFINFECDSYWKCSLVFIFCAFLFFNSSAFYSRI